MVDITNAAKKDRSGQTSSGQLESILNWIELSSNNYNLLVGKSTQNLNGVVAGMKLSKTAAYTELAAFVNQQCGTAWTPTISKGRWQSYYKKYKLTKHAYEDKGGTILKLTERRESIPYFRSWSMTVLTSRGWIRCLVIVKV
jgi:hypothetical protein